jgi:hypothetical protein
MMILDASGKLYREQENFIKNGSQYFFFVVLHNKTRTKDYIAWNQGVKAFKNQKPFQN